MPEQKDLDAYDARYRAVYAAGARFWNDHQPNPRLLECAQRLPPGSRCIEFGCGEGHEARALAGLGLKVTAIDLSPTAIQKAKEETPGVLGIEYLVGDATDLSGIGEGSFDIACDIKFLHMMNQDRDRADYLAGVRRVLKPGGLFYVEDMISPDDVVPGSEEEKTALNELKAFAAAHEGGEPTPRRIRTPDGEKEIMLPLCPECRFQTLAEYVSELEKSGFRILSAERGGNADADFVAIIQATAT